MIAKSQTNISTTINVSLLSRMNTGKVKIAETGIAIIIIVHTISSSHLRQLFKSVGVSMLYLFLNGFSHFPSINCILVLLIFFILDQIRNKFNEWHFYSSY